MAQMSLEELYRGESAGEKYGIMGEVMKDFLQNGRPSEYDERTWLDMLLVKHALIAADKMKLEGDSISWGTLWMRLCLKEMIPIAKKRKNGEGTLRLRKDGRWEGRIVVGYNEKSLPITKCVTAKTKTECSTKVDDLAERFIMGRGVAAAPGTESDSKRATKGNILIADL